MMRRTFTGLLMGFSPISAGWSGKKEMKEDVLHLEDPDEGVLEEFAISAGTWNLHQDEDGTWEFTVKIDTSKALKRSRGREEVFHNMPHFEATAVLPPKEASITKGKVIAQRESYDRKRDLNLSWFYYSGGGSLEKLILEVLEETGEVIHVNLTGCCDSLDSRVALRTKLKKDPKLKRSVQ